MARRVRSLAGAGVRPLRQRERTSLASSRRSRGVATRSRVAMSSAIVRRRLFRAPPVLWLALS